MKLLKCVAALSVLISLAACQSIPVAENAAKIDLSFAWPKTANVSFGHSPELKLGNVPPGTKYLEFNMRDFNNPYRHGGGTVEYTGGNTIPERALKDYQGPCPPTQHTYEITVKALNAEKNLILGEGAFSRKYPE